MGTLSALHRSCRRPTRHARKWVDLRCSVDGLDRRSIRVSSGSATRVGGLSGSDAVDRGLNVSVIVGGPLAVPTSLPNRSPLTDSHRAPTTD
jgi:hypothetical protein